MNNLAKITLADDVRASNLYDGLCKEKDDTAEQREEIPKDFTLNETAEKKSKKYRFGFKMPIRTPKTVHKKKKKLTPAFFRRNTLAACCVLLIAVAVWLNITFKETEAIDVYDTSSAESTEIQGKILGESTFVNGGEQNTSEDYFAVAVINRQRVRDEAIDMLREVVDNVETNSAIRENAFNEMTRMAEETNTEINIENLVTAKGFEDCVAVINGNTANIIVKTQGLAPEEVAQIQEIVYTQSGTEIENIKIIEKA